MMSLRETDDQVWLIQIRTLRSDVMWAYEAYLGKSLKPADVKFLSEVLGMHFSTMAIYNEEHCTPEIEAKLRLLAGPYKHAMFKLLFIKHEAKS